MPTTVRYKDLRTAAYAEKAGSAKTAEAATVWKQSHDAFTQTTNGSDYIRVIDEKCSTCGGFNRLHDKYQHHSKTSDPDSGDSVGH